MGAHHAIGCCSGARLSHVGQKYGKPGWPWISLAPQHRQQSFQSSWAISVEPCAGEALIVRGKPLREGLPDVLHGLRVAYLDQPSVCPDCGIEQGPNAVPVDPG